MKKSLSIFSLIALAAILAVETLFCAMAGASELKDRLGEKLRINLAIKVEAFNYDAKEKKALEKKIESYLLTAILKNADAVVTDKNFDAGLSLCFKIAAAFSKDENDMLWAVSAAASGGAKSGSGLSFHELFCFQAADLKKNCETIVSLFNDRLLKDLKESKRLLAIRQAAEEKKQREEYERLLKKQNELKKIEDIKSWKAKKYEEWKNNKSMSILDEELEAAGTSFEQLLKEFKQADSAEK